jgi:hypothetical protein
MKIIELSDGVLLNIDAIYYAVPGKDQLALWFDNNTLFTVTSKDDMAKVLMYLESVTYRKWRTIQMCGG